MTERRVLRPWAKITWVTLCLLGFIGVVCLSFLLVDYTQNHWPIMIIPAIFTATIWIVCSLYGFIAAALLAGEDTWMFGIFLELQFWVTLICLIIWPLFFFPILWDRFKEWATMPHPNK
jgi:hypothetical protein